MNRRNFVKSLFVIAVALPVAPILATVAAPRIINVHPGGHSLQRAVDAAGPGDTIFIYPGVYQGPIVVDRDDVTLRTEGAIIIWSPEFQTGR